MSFNLLPKKPKKGPVELQLTAMIDVFSMIVIFLILGGVMGAADIVVPPSMQVPKSKSKEGIESAPRVVIESNQVTFSMAGAPIPIEGFRNPATAPGLEKELQAFASSFIESQKKLNKPAIPLNIIADQNTPYRDIFDVVLAFRKAGFSSILFVATGQTSGAK